jgi:glycosyltransferase involved in cell wall biosynthesis
VISLVLPTYEEGQNILETLRRVERVLEGEEHEVLVVDDDSPDLTWKKAEEFAAEHPAVRVHRRITDRGLSGAILEGFRRSRGDVLAVMDADLSHDERVLPELLRRLRAGADLVVASRRVPGGGAENWPRHRRFASDAATLLARWVLPRPVSDPMSGYFVLRRGVYERVRDRLRPRGYKILLEIVVRAGELRLEEVPFVFRDRRSGYSKLSGFVVLNYLESLYELKFGVSPLDRLREAYHRGRYAKVRPLLGPGSLLDLGCGKPCDSMPDGAFLRELGRGVGLDRKPCEGPFEFKQGDIHRLPFPDASFDNVTAMEIFEHADDLDRVLSEVDRVLRPGGKLIVSAPAETWVWAGLWWLWTRFVGRMWHHTHLVNLDRRGWTRALESRFEVLSVRRHWRFDLVFEARKRAGGPAPGRRAP